MHLIDANCAIAGARPGCAETTSVDELIEEKDRVGVDRALLRINPTRLEFDVPALNRRLFVMGEAYRSVIPCPVVLPGGVGEVPGEEESVARCIEGGAGAVCLRPGLDGWSPEPWGCGDLLSELEARRMPVFCRLDQLDLRTLAEVAEQHPDLPVILAGVGYRRQRVVVPFLQSFSNSYLVVGGDYCVFRGLEACVAAVGPERLLFGTGYDEREMMGAVGYLMYADISRKERTLVGAGNLTRLMGGIQR